MAGRSEAVAVAADPPYVRFGVCDVDMLVLVTAFSTIELYIAASPLFPGAPPLPPPSNVVLSGGKGFIRLGIGFLALKCLPVGVWLGG